MVDMIHIENGTISDYLLLLFVVVVICTYVLYKVEERCNKNEKR